MLYGNDIDRAGTTALDPSDRGAMGKTAHVEPAEARATLFDLMDVARRLRRRVAEVLESVGISYPEYEALARLRVAHAPVELGQPGMDVGGVHVVLADVLDELEAAGLVRRAGLNGLVHVELTPRGAERALQGALQMDLVRLEFAAAFPARDRVSLGRLLSRVRRPAMP